MEYLKKYDNFINRMYDNIKIRKIRKNINHLEQELNRILGGIKYQVRIYNPANVYYDDETLSNYKIDYIKNLDKLRKEKEKLNKCSSEFIDDQTPDFGEDYYNDSIRKMMTIWEGYESFYKSKLLSILLIR